MLSRIARLSRHPAIPLLVLVLANVGFYAQIASARESNPRLMAARSSVAALRPLTSSGKASGKSRFWPILPQARCGWNATRP
jgi:hypothetical protein